MYRCKIFEGQDDEHLENCINGWFRAMANKEIFNVKFYCAMSYKSKMVVITYYLEEDE